MEHKPDLTINVTCPKCGGRNMNLEADISVDKGCPSHCTYIHKCEDDKVEINFTCNGCKEKQTITLE